MEKIDKSKRLYQTFWAMQDQEALKGKQIYFDSVAEMLLVRSREFPDRVHVYYYDEVVTYAQTNERSNKVANYLKAKGVQKGDIVSIMILNSPDVHYTMFGAQKLGAIAGMVNYMLMPPEIAYVLDDSKPKVVFVGNNFMPVFAKGYALAEHKPIVVEVATGDTNDASLAETTLAGILAEYPSDEALVHQSPSDPYLLLYSSGTTGQPKGVLLSNRGQFAINRACGYGNLMTADEIMYNPAPMFHVTSLCLYTYMSLFYGFGLVIRKTFSPTDWWPTVMKYGVTNCWCTPAMYMYLMYKVDPATIDRDKVKLRFPNAGGSAVPMELFCEFETRFGITLVDGYGLTECNGWALSTYKLPIKEGSLGHALPGCELEILDESNNILPYGEKGEICIRGEMVMIGYLNKPEATADALRGGWLHTGDLGWMDEQGYVYFAGRTKEMINRGGENIYPREIEIPLEAHPKIVEVAVIGVPDPDLGERAKACIVLAPGETMTGQEVKDYLKESIAKYKIPEIVQFYDSLPHSATGKVNKLELKKSSS